MRLYELTAHELAQRLEAGEITAQEIVADIFDRIEEVEPKVNAYITLTRERAEEAAKAADAARREGKASRWAGIPIAIKDNLSTAGVETTCASKILAGYKPPYDATVVAKIKEAGLPLLGKTNMDEFAMGSTTQNSAFKITANPWNLAKVPGGSSGGSAAAVAAGEAVWALGSDTGGSVRQPAAFSGIVGLKPTYGLVSRYGLVTYASSLDHVGPLTKDVTDCAILLNLIAGYDPLDATSAAVEVPDYTQFLGKEISGLRVGVPWDYFGEGLDSQVRTAVEKAIAQLEDLGAELVEVKLPSAKAAVATYYIIATSEASSCLGRFDGIRYGYRDEEAEDVVSLFKGTRGKGLGSEVKLRIILGTYFLSAGQYDLYYKKAQQVRTLMRQDFDRALSQCDVIVTPTSPTTALGRGEKSSSQAESYLRDIYTVTVNLAGLPAISIPCGLDSSGMPVGLQLIGRHFAEGTILQVAYAYEQAAGTHRLRAPLEVKQNG